MRILKKFREFLEMGIVKKCSPDKSRAEYLIGDADESYKSLREFIDKVGINDANSNIMIKEAYDVVMSLVRAKMLSDGFSASGSGAHAAEVSYLDELKFPEEEVYFANQLRYFRNGILYHGKKLDRRYAEKVYSFLSRIYPKLKKLLSFK